MSVFPAESVCLPRPRRIVVAGVGLLTPLGFSAWETFTGLLAGRTVADRLGRLPADVDAVGRVRAIGAVAVGQHGAGDAAVELAERAAREALTEAGADALGMPCWLGTSKGAVGALPAAGGVRTPAQARAVALGPCGFLSHELRRRLRVGQVQHHVAACASSLQALHAARLHLMTEPGVVPGRTALVVTSEAALLPAFIHSYRRLGVLAPQGDYAGRPLDERRQGFVLAEAGAAVVLRVTEQVQPGELELVDTAVAAEAFDLIRPSPGMPALRRVAARLAGHGRIDMVHPHAPGTPDHDPIELDALEAGLGRACSSLPRVYAAKGALGHGLGAAGLTSLVLAALMARSRRVPPMPWREQPLAHPLLGEGEGPLVEGSTHAVFAAGFAGHVAAALIRRVG